jgi:lipoprotein-releasing system ATP-binding protein
LGWGIVRTINQGPYPGEINNPDIVFADEPTGNLDTANAKELHRLFFDLRDRFRQTFLIVTHNEELAQMSDRVLHMKDGEIVSN